MKSTNSAPLKWPSIRSQKFRIPTKNTLRNVAACFKNRKRLRKKSDLLFQQIAEMEGSRAHRLEAQALIWIEIEYQPIGLFNILDPRTPAMKLDCPHLDAGQQAIGVVDEEIRLLVPVLLEKSDQRAKEGHVWGVRDVDPDAHRRRLYIDVPGTLLWKWFLHAGSGRWA